MKRALICLFCVVAALANLVACTKAEKAPTVTELLDFGEKYLLEMDYEQAIVQFTKVIEIEPMNARGYTGAAEVYLAVGQVDMAKNILEQGLALLGDDEIIVDMLVKIKKVEEAAIEDEKKAEEAMLEEKRKQEATDQQTELENKEAARVDAKNRLLLEELLSDYEAGGYEGILETVIDKSFMETTRQIRPLPFIVLNDSSDYGIGIYEDGYIYIGGYSDALRSGWGCWLVPALLSDSNGMNIIGRYRFEGEWSDDLPNGKGSVYFSTKCTGTLVNGLWHGTVISYYNSGGFDVIRNFENGKIITPDDTKVDSDGVILWAYGYKENGEVKYAMPGYFDYVWGVRPFADLE